MVVRSPNLHRVVDECLDSGILELAVSGERARPVDGRRPAVHENRDTDEFGYFLLGRTGARRTAGMSCDAAVATCGDGDCECGEFLRLGIERALAEGGRVEATETLVDVGNQFTKIAGERRQFCLDFLPVRMNVVVGFFSRHDHSQPHRSESFYGRNVLVLILNLTASAVMIGVIWFVQLVHYPLLAIIGPDRSIDVAVEHQRRTAWVVGAPMALEGATTLWLLFDVPAGVNRMIPWIAAAVLGVVLLSTVLLSVPLHARMAESPDANVGARLVATNWPRTIGWMTRGVLAVVMLWQATR